MIRREKIYYDAYLDDWSLMDEWGLGITNSDCVSAPEPILNLVEIPNRSGFIDMSEVVTGRIQYKPRKIKLECVRKTDMNEWRNFLSEFLRKYQGNKLRLSFKGDQSNYWSGRVVVTDIQRLNNVGKLTIEMTADPYKYESSPYFFTLTTDTDRIDGEMENFAMPACPEFVVPNDCVLHHDGIAYNLKTGSNVVPTIILHDTRFNSPNIFWTEGTKKITVEYQRGWL